MNGERELLPAARRFKHSLGPDVHRILWQDWDPIGLNSWAPDDEYDGYVWPVISLVSRGCSAAEVARYLEWASGEHMGCPLPPERTAEIAEMLCALKQSGVSK